MRPVLSRLRSFASLAVVFLAPLSAGCLSGGRGAPSQPAAVFPAKGDLARLPSLPPPADAFPVDAAPVDQWTFTSAAGGSAAAIGYDAASPAGKLATALALAHKDSVVLSSAMRCAAEELARFWAEKRALPTESLRRFTVARCGGTSPDVAPVVYGGDAPTGMSDEAVVEKATAAVRGAVEKSISGAGRHVLGVATSRTGKRFALAAIVGRDEVDLEPSPRSIDDARRVIVRGTVRTPAISGALAIVNQGDFGTAPCEPEPGLVLPAFAFSCRLAEADKSAWMEILVRRKGRVLHDIVADILLSDGDPSLLEYRPRPLGGGALPVSGAGVASALLSAVNRVRAQGALSPLTFAGKQSVENTRLAGTLIDASFKDRADDADRIALGLVAGWGVEGMIRNGALVTAILAPTRDAMEWLGFSLERPFGRSVLLDPDARQIAIGPVVPPGGAPALGAVVTTYALFESANHDQDTEAAYARVTQARKEIGRPPLARLADAPELDTGSRQVLAGTREPSDALDAAMRAVAERSGSRIEGTYVETNDLEHAPIPDAVLHAEGGAVAVRVTHHKVKGAAWGQYVILYILMRDARGPAVET